MVSCLVYLFLFSTSSVSLMGSYTKDEPTNHNANDEILQPVVRAGKQVQTNENCFFFLFFSLFVCII